MPRMPEVFRQVDRMSPNTDNGRRIDVGNTIHIDQGSVIDPIIDSAMNDTRTHRVGDEEFTYGPGESLNPGELTQSKAKQILRENRAQGQTLSDAQKRFFGAIAGGEEPRRR